MLKAQCPVFQMSETIPEILINRPGEDDFFRETFKLFPVCAEIAARPNFTAFKQLLDNVREAVNRYSLIECVEIVVVILESHGQPPYDERRKFTTWPPPLLFCILLD